jgi:hypothetical protein
MTKLINCRVQACPNLPLGFKGKNSVSVGTTSETSTKVQNATTVHKLHIPPTGMTSARFPMASGLLVASKAVPLVPRRHISPKGFSRLKSQHTGRLCDILQRFRGRLREEQHQNRFDRL